MAETRAFFLLLLFGPGNKTSQWREGEGSGEKAMGGKEGEREGRGRAERERGEEKKRKRGTAMQRGVRTKVALKKMCREKGAKRYSQNKVRRRHPT